MNNTKTELDFDKERDHPDFTKFFWPNLLIAIGIALFCGLGIIFTILNAELIDKIKPQTQVIIWAVALGSFGILRMVIFIRQRL